MSQPKEVNQPIYSIHVTFKTVQHGWFKLPFENKDTLFRVEVVSDLTYDLYSCVDIVVNRILKKYGRLVQ